MPRNREQQRKTDRAREKQNQGIGCCRCGRPPVPNHKCCQLCIDRARRHEQARRQHHTAYGKCRCGRVRAEGHRRCARCIADGVRDDKLKRARRREAGLCVICGGAREDKNHARCRKCNRAGLAYHFRIREAALMAYGGRCACCGEEGVVFLTLDHINGNGARHRRSEPRAKWLPQYLKLRGYPSGYQVLCYNCNMAKRQGPACPHQTRS